MLIRYWIGLTFLLLGATLHLDGQKAQSLTPDQQQFLKQKEDTLQVLAYAVLRDTSAQVRFQSVKTLIPKLVKALKTPNSFAYPFDRLESISIQYPQDSSFRIFTWQLFVDDNDYRYYGAIQMNTPELKLYPLVDRSYQVEENLENRVLPPNQWYGAIYYNIKQVEGSLGRYYLLFGYDMYSFFERRKLIDPLVFLPENGEPQFGAPVFISDIPQLHPERKKRVVLDYSADTSIRLNYDKALGLIIFDHLIEMASPNVEGMANVPDGSYEAYKLQEDGRWKYVPKVFDEVLEQAPRDNPVLDRQRDIMGRKRN